MKDRCRIRIGRNKKSEAGFRNGFGSFSLVCKRDFLRTVTPALLTDGLRIEGGI